MIKPLEEIRTGMILQKEVRDMSGRLLLGEGEEITDRHLRIFRAWGVAEVDIREPLVKPANVEAPTPQTTPPDDPRLIELFRHADLTHPFMKQLYQFSQEIPWSSHEDAQHGH